MPASEGRYSRLSHWGVPTPRQARTMARGWAVLVLVLVVGWLVLRSLGVPQLQGWFQEPVGMSPLTAGTFMATALTVLAFSFHQHQLARALCWLLVSGVLLKTAASLVVSLHLLDRVLMSWGWITATPLRAEQLLISSNTGFLLLALSMLMMTRGHRQISLGMLFLLFLLSVVTLHQFVFGTLQAPLAGNYYPISLQTAVGLMLLGVAVGCLQHAEGVGSIAFEPHSGGFAARWLLPAAVVLPVLLAWGSTVLVHLQLMAWNHAMGWLAAGTTVCLLGLSYLLSLALKHNELEHHRHMQGIRAREQRYRSVTELAADAIITTNAAGKITSFNRSAEQLFGYTEREMLGQPFLMLMPHRFREHYQQNLLKFMQDEVQDLLDKRVEILALTRTGREVPVELSVSVWEIEEGKFFTGSLRDISQRKQAELDRTRLAAIVEASNDAIIGKTLDGFILSWNHAAERTYGHLASEMVGQHISQLLDPAQVQQEQALLDQIARGGRIVNLETRRTRKDGTVFDALLNISPILGADGTVVGAASITRDVTETRKVQQERDQALRYSQAQAAISQILEEALTPEQAAEQASVILARVAGLDFTALVTVQEGQGWIKPTSFTERLDPQHLAHMKQPVPYGQGAVWNSLQQDVPFYLDHHQDPAGVLPQLQGIPVTAVAFIPLVGLQSTTQAPLVFVACWIEGKTRWSEEDRNLLASAGRSMRIALERQERLLQMEQAALRDPLTLLGNRRAFVADLEREHARLKQQGSSLGVLMLDLDGLKEINDRFGHAGGDRLLKTFAQQLKAHVRPEQPCYRLGGDEFAVLLPHLSQNSSDDLHLMVREVIAEVKRQGFPHADVSAGLAFFPEERSTTEDLVRLADERMYQMKAQHHAGPHEPWD